MVVPVVHQQRAVGAISIGCVRQHEYSPATAALLSTVASQVATALRHAQTFKELEASYMQTVVALAAALEAKDSYTADHADTIARMAVAVGRELSLSEPELRRVEYAALLHDVGKIAVSPEVLDKPGPLSPEERRGPDPAHADRRADHLSHRLPASAGPARARRTRALGRLRLSRRAGRR